MSCPTNTLAPRRFLPLLFIAAMCFSSSCSDRNDRIGLKPLGVFVGFSYVGNAPYPQDDVTAQIVVPPNGQMELPLPDKLEAGRQYIFHHHRPIDDERLALVTLPARLGASGLRVTRAPSSPRDLMALVYGGLLFKIEFEDNGHKGFIFNRLCPQLMRAEKGGGQWVEEDYVLAIPLQH